MSIRSEIETRVINYGIANNIPVAVENVPFTKPIGGKWLEINLLDQYSRNREVSAAGVRVTGMFQINCYAKVGTGMKDVEALAADIVALFPVVPKIGIVSIEAPLNASNGQVLDGYVVIPLTGRYRTEY